MELPGGFCPETKKHSNTLNSLEEVIHGQYTWKFSLQTNYFSIFCVSQKKTSAFNFMNHILRKITTILLIDPDEGLILKTLTA